MTKRQLVPRTRNLNTMTESQFFGTIRSALRNAFRYNWEPSKVALSNSRRASQRNNKRVKYEYQCAICKQWFIREEVEIDHIKECGSLRSFEDIGPFLQRMLCENPEDYQILCKPHHKDKTQDYLYSKK